MAMTKPVLYSEARPQIFARADLAVADLFQVLASPIRLAVLRLLLGGERCVGDLLADLGIAQPRLSNHLACLRNCGLVHTRRDGMFVYYAIANPGVAELVILGEELASSNADGLERCPIIAAEAWAFSIKRLYASP